MLGQFAKTTKKKSNKSGDESTKSNDGSLRSNEGSNKSSNVGGISSKSIGSSKSTDVGINTSNKSNDDDNDTVNVEQTSDMKIEKSTPVSSSASEAGDAAVPDEGVEWIATQTTVFIQAAPAMAADQLDVIHKGQIVVGTKREHEGRSWVKVTHRDALGECHDGWILVDGQSPGLDTGSLLEPVQRIAEHVCAATQHLHRMRVNRHRATCCEVEDPGDLSANPITRPWVVRRVTSKGLSVFAARDILPGEIIIEEKPFFKRPPIEDATSRIHGLQTLLSQIREPLLSPDEAEGTGTTSYLHASVDMVCDVVGYTRTNYLKRKEIQNLHYPDLDSDHPLVKVTKKVAQLCLQRVPECGQFSEEELHRAILAIEINSFAGGECLLTTSRLKHSCAPNVSAVAAADKWVLKPVKTIREGEELNLSYLGKELLLPTEFRRQYLWRSKCFNCKCARCTAGEEPACGIPCRFCAEDIPKLKVMYKHGVPLRMEPDLDATIRTMLPERALLTPSGLTEGDWKEVWYVGPVRHHAMKLHGWVLARDGYKVFCEETTTRIPCKPLRDLSINWKTAMGQIFNPGMDIDMASIEKNAQTEKNPDYESRDVQQAMGAYEELEALPDFKNLWVPFLRLENAFKGYMTYCNGQWRCCRCGKIPPNEEALAQAESLLGFANLKMLVDHLQKKGTGTQMGATNENIIVISSFLMNKAKALSVVTQCILGRRHWSYRLSQLLCIDMMLTYLLLEQSEMNRKAWAEYVLTDLVTLWDWLESIIVEDPGSFLHSRVTEALRVTQDVAMKDENDDNGGSTSSCYRALMYRAKKSKVQVDVMPFQPILAE